MTLLRDLEEQHGDRTVFYILAIIPTSLRSVGSERNVRHDLLPARQSSVLIQELLLIRMVPQTTSVNGQVDLGTRDAEPPGPVPQFPPSPHEDENRHSQIVGEEVGSVRTA